MLCDVTLLTMLSAGPDVTKDLESKRVLEHLDAVLASPFFVSSRRCQEFLRYVVVEAIAGRGDLIKERNIAQDVFGKGTRFEPSEDSVVRVKAREVRKRLLDYYATVSGDGVRIDLPVGSYLPRIRSLHAPVASAPTSIVERQPSAKSISRRRLGMMLGGSVAGLGLAALVPLYRHATAPLDVFWNPVFATKKSLLIFIPVLDDPEGRLGVKIGVGPAAALRKAADYLTEHKYPYDLRFGPDLTFAQMIEHPTLLLGGFASVWAMRIARDLRYTLSWDDAQNKIILDKTSGRVWRPVNETPGGFADQDFGLLCRLFDPASGQIVMIAAGITTFGTAGAAGLLFDPARFSELERQAPRDWKTKNFEAIVRVGIIGMATSSPQVVASYFW
jgi:hypothetical protein